MVLLCCLYIAVQWEWKTGLWLHFSENCISGVGSTVCQFWVSPLWCRRLWYVDAKLVREVNLCFGQRERAPQDHRLSQQQAIKTPNPTHSSSQTANQSSTTDIFWTDPVTEFLNKYTAEHGRLHQGSNQILQWLQKKKCTGMVWERLLSSRGRGGGGRTGREIKFLLLFSYQVI